MHAYAYAFVSDTHVSAGVVVGRDGPLVVVATKMMRAAKIIMLMVTATTMATMTR